MTQELNQWLKSNEKCDVRSFKNFQKYTCDSREAKIKGHTGTSAKFSLDLRSTKQLFLFSFSLTSIAVVEVKPVAVVDDGTASTLV